MRKVCVVVASRANYGRIKSVLSAIKNHKELELQLVVTASALLYRYGKVIDIIKKDGFKVQDTAYIVVDGENLNTMAKSTGLAIIELTSIFDRLKPDVVLTVADRYETLATAVSASYMNLPLAHTQGGEITGSIDDSVRNAITKLAHIHFPATQLSKERIIKMGEDPETVFLTGCPAMDLVANTDMRISSDLVNKFGVGSNLDLEKPYLVVVQHPVTTECEFAKKQVKETIKAISKLKVQTIWLWPNVDAGSDDVSKSLRVFREKEKPHYLHFVRNFSPEDYLRVINKCSCIIGNSSSAIREGAFLGIPAVNVGSRQQNRERSENVIDVDYNSEEIYNAIQKQLGKKRYNPNNLYGDGEAGKKIADILAKADFRIQKKHML